MDPSLIKVTGTPNVDLLAAIDQLTRQRKQPGFVFGVTDTNDYSVTSYFSALPAGGQKVKTHAVARQR